MKNGAQFFYIFSDEKIDFTLYLEALWLQNLHQSFRLQVLVFSQFAANPFMIFFQNIKLKQRFDKDFVFFNTKSRANLTIAQDCVPQSVRSIKLKFLEKLSAYSLTNSARGPTLYQIMRVSTLAAVRTVPGTSNIKVNYISFYLFH